MKLCHWYELWVLKRDVMIEANRSVDSPWGFILMTSSRRDFSWGIVCGGGCSVFVSLCVGNVTWKLLQPPRHENLRIDWQSFLYHAVIFVARCYASAAYAVARCPSVCPSVCYRVTFVYSVERNKRIFNFFPPSGGRTILVYPHQTLWPYIDGDPPDGGVECRCSRQKSRLSTNIWLHRVLSTMWPPSVIHPAASNRGKLVTLIACVRVVCFSRKTVDEVFVARRLNVTPKTTEQNLIVGPTQR